MAFPWLALGVGLAAGSLLGGGGRRRQTQQLVMPELKMPYLPTEEIATHPYLARLGDIWWNLVQQFGTPMPSVSPKIYENLTNIATSVPNIQTAIDTLNRLMRPLFEEQLSRSLDVTREQMASTLGTPRGGSLAEVMRRQIQEAERAYQAQLAQMAQTELGAQRELMRWATTSIPVLRQAEAQAMFTPYQLLAQGLAPYMGTFVAPQIVQPTYRPSFIEQLMPGLLPWILTQI